MINRWSAVVLLLGFSLVGIPLFFYYEVREEWLFPYLIAGLCGAGAIWLTLLWAVKVVFPFVRTAMESTAAEAGETVPVRVPQGMISRWALGAGVPIVVASLEILPILFYPSVYLSGGWIGALVLLAFVVFLVRALQYYSFFTNRRGEAGMDGSSQPGSTLDRHTEMS